MFICFCIPRFILDLLIFFILIFIGFITFYFDLCFILAIFFTEEDYKNYQKNNENKEEIKTNIFYDLRALLISPYIYYIILLYSNINKNFYKVYYPYFGGRYNEFGFLNILKFIVPKFISIYYYIYYCIIQSDFKIDFIVSKYFYFFDLDINNYYFLGFKYIFMILCIIYWEKFRYSYPCVNTDFVEAFGKKDDYEGKRMIKLGKTVLNRNYVYHDDDVDDDYFKEINLYTTEDDED